MSNFLLYRLAERLQRDSLKVFKLTSLPPQTYFVSVLPIKNAKSICIKFHCITLYFRLTFRFDYKISKGFEQ